MYKQKKNMNVTNLVRSPTSTITYKKKNINHLTHKINIQKNGGKYFHLDKIEIEMLFARMNEV